MLLVIYNEKCIDLLSVISISRCELKSIIEKFFEEIYDLNWVIDSFNSLLTIISKYVFPIREWP